MKLFVTQTAIGKIGIAEDNGAITGLFFENDPLLASNVLHGETPLLREACRQLQAYLAGEAFRFDLPLAPAGSDFMLAVWGELCRIPYGCTASYGKIAAAVGNPRGARAVGMACNRNPIPIFIPCHRVIGANGKMTGYSGGQAMKERLLELERRGLLPVEG